jgi:Beta-lactamase
MCSPTPPGVPQAPAGTTTLAALADWEGMCARIADLPLLWEPGTATGYHALTFGYILGEARAASPAAPSPRSWPRTWPSR